MADKPQDQKPDFGEDRSIFQYDLDHFYTDIARTVERVNEPKGVLSANTKLIGIILKKDTGPNPAEPLDKKKQKGKKYYHVYVQNVHYNKIIPLALKDPAVVEEFRKQRRTAASGRIARRTNMSTARTMAQSGRVSSIVAAGLTVGLQGLYLAGRDIYRYFAGDGVDKLRIPSDLSGSPLDRLFEVMVANEFNDGTSYMVDTTGGIHDSAFLEDLQIVNIKYDSVNAGVPSGGKIVEVLYDELGAPLKIKTDQLKQLVAGTGLFLDNSAFIQDVKDLKLPQITNAVANKVIEQKAKAATCKNITIKNYRGSFNYQGTSFYFDAKCKDFIKVLAQYKTEVKNTKTKNLLNKSGLGSHFKSILRKSVQSTPYFLGGTGPYTPKQFYLNATNIEKVGTATVGDKPYKEYWKKFLTKGGTLTRSYDCSGIGSFLAFHSGFILGLNNFEAQKDRFGRRASTQFPNLMGIELTLEQFANTPGACAIANNGGHAYWSAGEGIKKNKNGISTVVVYEAGYFQYVTKRRNAEFKATGKKNKAGVPKYEREDGWGDFGNDNTEIWFGIPASFIYADRRNLWTPRTGLKSQNSYAKAAIKASTRSQTNAASLLADIRQKFSQFKTREEYEDWRAVDYQIILVDLKRKGNAALRKAVQEEVQKGFKDLEKRLKEQQKKP